MGRRGGENTAKESKGEQVNKWHTFYKNDTTPMQMKKKNTINIWTEFCKCMIHNIDQ